MKKLVDALKYNDIVEFETAARQHLGKLALERIELAQDEIEERLSQESKKKLSESVQHYIGQIRMALVQANRPIDIYDIVMQINSGDPIGVMNAVEYLQKGREVDIYDVLHHPDYDGYYAVVHKAGMVDQNDHMLQSLKIKKPFSECIPDALEYYEGGYDEAYN